MKKILLLFLALPFFLQAQLTSDDFESYTLGDFDAQWDPNNWVGWFGAASGTVISDDQANSGSNSVYVTNQPAANDLVALLPVLTTGVWEVSFYQYIPSGSGAYFNIQHNYTNTAGDWAAEIYFGDETLAAGTITTEGVTAGFNNVVHDAWIENRMVFNFLAEQAEYYYNGDLVQAWSLPTNSQGGPGLNQVNGINLFASCIGAGCISNAYYDDILVEEVPLPPFDVSISTPLNLSEYTEVPIAHVTPLQFGVDVFNQGANAASNVEVTVNVYDGGSTLVYTESMGSMASLASGESANFSNAAATYTPTTVDSYSVEYVTSITETDSDETNNTVIGTTPYSVTDSTYARDDGMFNNGLGLNNVAGGLLGHNYELLVDEEVVAMSMSFAGGAVGEGIRAHIYATDASGKPTDLLYSSEVFQITEVGGIGLEIYQVLNFPEPSPLLAGNYAFLIEQRDLTNLLLSTTPSIFTPGRSWASADLGANWDLLDDLGFQLAMNVHPIFSNAAPPVATKEPTFAQEISVSPNPTSGKTSLNFTLKETHDIQIDLYNLQGQNVYALSDNNASGEVQYDLDLSNLPIGMYMVSIRTGKEIMTSKINVTR